MSSRPKWRCSMCTYDNWMAAIKCTLCRTPRSSVLIEEEMQRLKVSPKELENISGSHASVSSETEHLMRCASCTYLNKPLSFKCEQCFNVLCDPSELVTSDPKPSISTDSPASPFSSFRVEKWSCLQCTYENWPKSQHCVMCGGSPSATSANTVVDTVGDGVGKGSSPNSNESTSSGQADGKPSKDALWLAACRAVLDSDMTPIERYLSSGGRMERKLTKQDCLHLNLMQQSTASATAPHGFVNSDLASVSSNEDTTNRTSGVASPSNISSEESDKTGSGTKIRAGLTLVDLAIRFGRTDLINLFIALSGLHTTSAAVSIGSSTKSGSRSCLASCQPNEATTQYKLSQHGSRRQSNIPIHPSLQHIVSRAPGLSSRCGIVRSKWMPCQASPHIAKELRGTFALGIKHHQGDFPCAFLTDWSTFALPYSVAKLPAPVKYLLLSELCDTQAQAVFLSLNELIIFSTLPATELEDDAKAINWWFIPGQKQASRLFALWNRTAGDCLLDSVLQACWGIFDRDNVLRRTLAESLRSCEASFYSRWRDYEALQAACHYILDENQCRRDWDNVLTAASQPGGALEQIHIFALSHILRRPVIVYGVKYIKNYRDEPIGIANFQGIYLPLLWDRHFCSPNPIVLGYTRGHFTALVPMEPQLATGGTSTESQMSPCGNCSPFTSPRTPSSSSSRKQSPTPSDDCSSIMPTANPAESQLMAVAETLLSGGIVNSASSSQQPYIYLPLVDRQGANTSQTLLRDWLDVVSTRRGLPLARLRLHPRHPLIDRMMEDWLGSYRSLAKLSALHLPTSLSGCQTNLDFESLSSSASSSSSSSSSSLPANSESCMRPDVPESDTHRS
ncbi:hypothetical protein AHF37_05650 [Paragonimus kellicotti]|nr:hypothetical protein AHF37_05650 [Paragonimus kellicotti]